MTELYWFTILGNLHVIIKAIMILAIFVLFLIRKMWKKEWKTQRIIIKSADGSKA